MSVKSQAALAATHDAGEAAATAGVTNGLIDIHTHAIPPVLPDLGGTDSWDRWPSIERTAADQARIDVGGRPYREIDDRCWSADARLVDMDAEGVEVQVISPIPITLCHDAPAEGAVRLARAQNDYFAELVAYAPERFKALGAVPLQSPQRAAEELVRCVTELGFVGVEIGTRVGHRELTDPTFAPFFDAAAQLGALIFVHPVDAALDPRYSAHGIAFGAGMPSETGLVGAGMLTSAVLSQRPELRVCLAHGGGCLPALLPRLDLGERLRGGDVAAEQLPSALARSLFCDSLTYDMDNLLLATHRFGPEHVLLGTDYPFAARERPAGRILRSGDARLPTDICAAIGRDNAQHLIQNMPTPVTAAPVEQRSRR